MGELSYTITAWHQQCDQGAVSSSLQEGVPLTFPTLMTWQEKWLLKVMGI